jgi:hypothetical protein
MDTKNIQFLIEMFGKLYDNQAKAGTDIKVWRKEMAAETEAIKARTRAIRENMGTSHKEMVAVIEPGRNTETMAYQEMEAHLEEEKPASVDRKPEVAQEQEVPAEDAEVMPVEEPKKKRRRYRKLAAERRRQKQKNSTLESCGPPK